LRGVGVRSGALIRGQDSSVATSGSTSATRRWRRWLRRLATLVLVLAILPSGVIVVALIEPDNGPGAQVVGFAEQLIRQNEDLHYNIHRVLGKVFSFCPCTQGLSRSQYQKAFYHRPRPSPQP
jgi:hypothetical protein